MSDNILLVEDEEALRMVLGDRLRREGYLVDSASDGDTGFEKATSLPFDLMIFDLMLPGRNGFDLCRDIRRAGLATPVLMLTALREPDDMIAGLKVGADDYVTKPFDMLELSARIEGLLRRHPGRRKEATERTFPQEMSTQPTEVIGLADSTHPTMPSTTIFREELERRDGASILSSKLAAVIPRLRRTLDGEQTPRAPHNAAWLGAAAGIVEFLEDMFQDMRSSKRRR
jgi:CheY-like chemotaxis protein